jgi:hypothetical protein
MEQRFLADSRMAVMNTHRPEGLPSAPALLF